MTVSALGLGRESSLDVGLNTEIEGTPSSTLWDFYRGGEADITDINIRDARTNPPV